MTTTPFDAGPIQTRLTALELAEPLVLQLSRAPGESVLIRHRLRPSDFGDVASEAWRDGCLRAGHPSCPLHAVPLRVQPVPDSVEPRRCLGFELAITRPDGTAASKLFTLRCLRPLADQLAGPLVEAAVLKPGDSFHFEVRRDEPPPNVVLTPGCSSAESGLASAAIIRSPALSYLTLPLRPLIERATAVGPNDETLPPVFYTEAALARAEACARRGQAAALETGGVLVGSLASCPDTGEFFSLVHDVLEVRDADEKEFSLCYSGQTWQRLRRILDARQAAAPARAERLMGQAHGHPFRPNDGRVCAECAQRTTCTLTSAWASPDDQLWHRAVFSRQPWALCHIFGLAARGDDVHQLFGLRDGCLQARGFHLLPEGLPDLDFS